MSGSNGAVTLADLPVGESARIAAFGGTSALRQRLREMGLTPGATVRMVRIAPLGDPLELAVRGYRLSLRREEAAAVEVTAQLPERAPAEAAEGL